MTAAIDFATGSGASRGNHWGVRGPCAGDAGGYTFWAYADTAGP